MGLGRLFVLAGSARASLLTVNQPIRGLAFGGEPGLPWGRVRPGARRSGWPDLFLTVEACVNIEALISTSEAFSKHDWCFGPPKRLVGEIAPSVFSLADFLGTVGNHVKRSVKSSTLKNKTKPRRMHILPKGGNREVKCPASL